MIVRRVAGVELHVFGLDDDADISLSQAIATLSEDERGRMERFVFPRDGARFARGRGIVRRTLAAETGEAPAAVRLVERAGDKPRLAGGAVDFNLSHSGGRGVIAIARNGSVGVDLELANGPARDWSELMSLARRCMVEGERTVLEALATSDRVERFLEFWTAKEARMKVWGEGMTLDPLSIRLTLEDGRAVGFADDAGDVRLYRLSDAAVGEICSIATSPDRDQPRRRLSR